MQLIEQKFKIFFIFIFQVKKIGQVQYLLWTQDKFLQNMKTKRTQRFVLFIINQRNENWMINYEKCGSNEINNEARVFVFQKPMLKTSTRTNLFGGAYPQAVTVI